MIISYIVISILVLISAISKAIMDTISFHFDTSVFKNAGTWFNPDLSWNNKYTWSKNKFISWILQNPLVSITDAWHFFGFIQRTSLFACLLFPIIWWSVPIFYIGFALMFHLFFTYIFIKK